MPLLDHFRGQIRKRRPPEGFHNAFAAAICDHLNLNVLSSEFLAEFQIHVGQRVEIDIPTFEYANPDEIDSGDGDDRGGGSATAVVAAPVWAPPTPLHEMPTIFPDILEIQIVLPDSARQLVAAIELISPGNKDRPKTRRDFAVKCAAYLQQCVGVVTVDIVTNRRANLHNELINLLETGNDYKMPRQNSIYTVAYRPVQLEDAQKIDIWPMALNVGERLPLVPLPLGMSLCVPLDLEVAYMEACRRSRLAQRQS